MPRRLLAMLAATAAVFASACSGGNGGPASLDDFQQAVVTTRDRADFALARISRAKSFDEYLNRMEEAAVVIDDAADDLAGVGAAENFEEETDRLVGALHQLSVDLSATASDARDPLFGAAVTSAKGLNFDSWDKANLALAGMVGKGIQVTVLQRH